MSADNEINGMCLLIIGDNGPRDNGQAFLR